MSADTVTQFLERLKDEAFDSECQDAIKSATLQAMVEVGARHGLAFTADELVAGLAAAEPEDELSDEVLDDVSGGRGADPGASARTGGRSAITAWTLRSISTTTCPPSRPGGIDGP